MSRPIFRLSRPAALVPVMLEHVAPLITPQEAIGSLLDAHFGEGTAGTLNFMAHYAESDDEGDFQLAQAQRTLAGLLASGDVRSVVSVGIVPRLFRVPVEYWFPLRPPTVEWPEFVQFVEAPGYQDAMEGAPILFCESDFNELVSRIPLDADFASLLDQPEADRRLLPKVEWVALTEWFTNVRIPAFEGRRPPSHDECLAAALNHFPDKRVPRGWLLEARRETAPAEWLKRGPRGPRVNSAEKDLEH